jgi:hypothetical protein
VDWARVEFARKHAWRPVAAQQQPMAASVAVVAAVADVAAAERFPAWRGALRASFQRM